MHPCALCRHAPEQVWVKVLEVRPEPGGAKLAGSMRAVSQEDGRDLDPDNTLAAGGAAAAPAPAHLVATLCSEDGRAGWFSDIVWPHAVLPAQLAPAGTTARE